MIRTFDDLELDNLKEVLQRGQPPGKRLFGLRVVSDDGARPSVERCAARAALSAASVLLLGLGLLPALFTRSGRALHDISAGTRVVESP